MYLLITIVGMTMSISFFKNTFLTLELKEKKCAMLMVFYNKTYNWKTLNVLKYKLFSLLVIMP